MMEIKSPKISFEENESKNYAKFVVEPLERGFGTTIGNSLRQIGRASCRERVLRLV